MSQEHGSSALDAKTEFASGSETQESPEGSAVLQEVVRMTGLPETYLDQALSDLLGKPEASVNDLTLGQLRSLLLECLESVNAEFLSDSASSDSIN